MGVLNYAQARKAYAPSCQPTDRPGAQEAWDAHQMVMRHHNYKLRAEDTGSRNCRNATGSNLKSMHAFFIACTILLWNLGKRIAGGLAADFNWQSNPYGPRLITDMPREMVDDILAIRTNNGVRVFMWGGYWSGNKDAMHYDIVCAPEDLATGINWSTVRGSNKEDELDMGAVEDIIKEIRTGNDNLAENMGTHANNIVNNLAARISAAAGKPLDVDEDALAAALAPYLPNLVAKLSDEDIARVAEAVNDEQHRRSAS